MSGAGAARGDRLLAVGAALATTLAVACVLLPERVPFQDVPAHAMLTGAVGDALRGVHPSLVANPWPVHGWIYELCGYALSLMTGPLLATRLLLAAALAATPVAVARVLRALGLPLDGVAFAPLLLLSLPVAQGYVPFVVSMPLALFALAELVSSSRRASLAGLLLVLTWGAHAFGVAVALVASAAVLIPRDGLRAAIRALLPAAPAVALTVLGSLGGEAARGLLYRGDLVQRAARSLDALVDVLQSAMDTDVAHVWALSLVAAAALSPWRPLRPRLPGLALGAALLAVALALPDEVVSPSITDLSARFLLPLWLLAPVALGVRLAGRRRALLAVPLGLAVLLHGLTLAALMDAGRRPGPVERLLDRAPPGQRVLNEVLVTTDLRSPFSRVQANRDLFRYAVTRGGVVVGGFGHVHLPVHGRSSGEPIPPGRVMQSVLRDAHLADWIVTDVPERVLPSTLHGTGFRLRPEAEDSGLRLLRVEHDRAQ